MPETLLRRNDVGRPLMQLTAPGRARLAIDNKLANRIGELDPPAKLPVAHRRALNDACDRHLAIALDALQPEWAIGVGAFAEQRLRAVRDGDRLDPALARRIEVAQILHPSPASPAANRGWNEAVDRKLSELGVLPR